MSGGSKWAPQCRFLFCTEGQQSGQQRPRPTEDAGVMENRSVGVRFHYLLQSWEVQLPMLQEVCPFLQFWIAGFLDFF